MKIILIFATTIAFAYGWSSLDQRYLDLVTGLKYGDSCSWEDEQMRQNYTISLLDADIWIKLLRIQRFRADVLKTGKKLCNAVELLVCNESTETCVCGDPGIVILGLDIDSSSRFTKEIVNNQTICRWSKESYCASQDLPVPSQMRAVMNSKCVGGTSCKTLSGGSSCSMTSILKYLISNRIRSEKTLVTDMYSGKVCTCQQDTSFAFEVDSDENDVENSVHHRIRRKRSAIFDISDASYGTGAMAHAFYH